MEKGKLVPSKWWKSIFRHQHAVRCQNRPSNRRIYHLHDHGTSTLQTDGRLTVAAVRPLSRLAVNFTAGLAFSRLISRLIRGLRSSSIRAPSLPLSLHIRSDSFTARRRASSLQTFFCRPHAVHNRPIFNAVCIILCDLL